MAKSVGAEQPGPWPGCDQVSGGAVRDEAVLAIVHGDQRDVPQDGVVPGVGELVDFESGVPQYFAIKVLPSPLADGQCI